MLTELVQLSNADANAAGRPLEDPQSAVQA